MRDITLESTEYFDFTTRATTGVPTVLAGTPALSVLEENNATPITAGVSVSVDRASVVGLNMATIVATAANGYEAGKSYSIYISTGTVDSVSVVGEIVGQFTVGEMLKPTTAGRTLDVTATGAAGIDWGNVENASTAVDLSGTDIQLCDTVTTLTGHTAQTGDTYALANGAAGFVAIDTVVDSILVDTGTTIPATIATAQADLDIITGADGVNLLSATQASIDAIETDTSTTLDTKIDTIDTVVDAVKVTTDKFVFTVANQVDANIQSINDTTITGDGGSGTEFGV